MITQFQLHDIFATKGLEYLLIIAYLISFIFFWRYLDGRLSGRILAADHPLTYRVVDWFRHAEELFYHPGHAWARPLSRSTALVGMDDFAHKLVGQAHIMLPPSGSMIRKGEIAWQIEADGKTIPMLSPVNGTVVEVNENAASGSLEAHSEPFTNGWLLKVRTPRLRSQMSALLTGHAAQQWMENTVQKMSEYFSGRDTRNLGVVLQDGGVVRSGFARELFAEDWDIAVKEFLLTAGTVPDTAPQED